MNYYIATVDVTGWDWVRAAGFTVTPGRKIIIRFDFEVSDFHDRTWKEISNVELLVELRKGALFLEVDNNDRSWRRATL